MDAERDGADSPLPQPGRLWTVEERSGDLDELRELLPQLRAWVVRLRKVHDELQRLAAFWGKEIDASDHPDGDLKHGSMWNGPSSRLGWRSRWPASRPRGSR